MLKEVIKSLQLLQIEMLLTMKHILGKVLKPKNKTYKSSSMQLEKAAERCAATSKQLVELINKWQKVFPTVWDQ